MLGNFLTRYCAIEALKARSLPREENTHFFKRHKPGNLTILLPTGYETRPDRKNGTYVFRQLERQEHSNDDFVRPIRLAFGQP
ncbi:MAG: hypothetical protein DME22_15920 [Verrucomicrobia bacterium]|nr:MAG: hypothetical protein DME22_15920 [Verrucomicrobiota bacterium]PYJ92538.1 MAG: hypothetical protein DME23_27260 [Verrucomicrobiota bacterium]